jgi:hypothetical protein
MDDDYHTKNGLNMISMILWSKMKESKIFERQLVNEIKKFIECNFCDKIIFNIHDNEIRQKCDCYLYQNCINHDGRMGWCKYLSVFPIQKTEPQHWVFVTTKFEYISQQTKGLKSKYNNRHAFVTYVNIFEDETVVKIGFTKIESVKNHKYICDLIEKIEFRDPLNPNIKEIKDILI